MDKDEVKKELEKQLQLLSKLSERDDISVGEKRLIAETVLHISAQLILWF